MTKGVCAFDGDVWCDGVVIRQPANDGSPEAYDVKLTAEEQSFLDNETEVLCEMLDQHQIEIDQNLPPEVWHYIREKKALQI